MLNNTIELTNLTHNQILSEIKKKLQENTYDSLILQMKTSQLKGQNKQNMENTFLFKQEYETTESKFGRSNFNEQKKRLIQMSHRLGSGKIKEMERRIKTCATNLQTNSTQFQNIMMRAKAHYDQKQYQIAQKLYQQINLQNLSQIEKGLVSLELGNCYFRSKKYQKAIDTYLCSTFPNEKYKQKGQRYNNLGSCYAKLKMYQLSLKYYNQAIKIYSSYRDVDCSNLLNNVGIIYMNAQMFKVAQKYFSESIQQRKQKSPGSVDLLCVSYIKLAICQKMENKFEQAIQNLLIALNWAQRGEGDIESVLKQLAFCCQKLKRWNQALEYYQKLSLESKQQGFIYQQVSLIHKQLGNKSEFSKFIKISLNEYKKESNQRKISQIQNIIRTYSLF